jgi:hypothetical protein
MLRTSKIVISVTDFSCARSRCIFVSTSSEQHKSKTKTKVMKKKKAINNSKLHLAKEKIAVLSDKQIAGIKGGNEAARSTNWDFTCTWCTTVLPAPQDQ